MNILTVPGVGGSESAHWQSWLERQLSNSIRVEQDHWNQPVLDVWVKRFHEVLSNQPEPVVIVAHSFGCLTSVAALAQHPELRAQVRGLLLVAPANPERFSHSGLRQANQASIADQFLQTIQVPTRLIASQTDPWLGFEDAKKLAQQWHASLHDLGEAGHINVASGYGAWPEVFYHLDALNTVYEHHNVSPINQQRGQSMSKTMSKSMALTHPTQILPAF